MNMMIVYESGYPVNGSCPDNFKAIESLTDFDAIRSKVNRNEYKNPWDFVNNVNQVFENVRLHCKESSYLEHVNNLEKWFNETIDLIMVNLGFCCGQRYEFTSLSRCCHSHNNCVITPSSEYYTNDVYSFCKRCFTESQTGSTISANIPSGPVIIEKKDFVRKIYTDREMERFVKCETCGRLNHEICVGYLRNNPALPFNCQLCRSKNSLCRPIVYRAKDIPSNNLSEHIENRVKRFFKINGVNCGEVTIRVLASSKKATRLELRTKNRFPEMAVEYPYTSKAIYAFQNIDDQDVCFFGLYVQEYGSDAPAPNTGQVYLSYIDSVQYFQPKDYRTRLYNEVLLAYMEYVRNLGFLSFHIWACPPTAGVDYIFNCRPPLQKVPSLVKLQEWYKNLLNTAISENIVSNFTNLLDHIRNNALKSATDVPYFDGDIWQILLEEEIKRQEENVSVPVIASTEITSKSNVKLGVEHNVSGVKPSLKASVETCNDILTRAGYFVVHFVLLHPHQLIYDPDPILPNNVITNRSYFLDMLKWNRTEFSSLRRAKHSTQVMLHEIIRTREIIEDDHVCINCKCEDDIMIKCKVCVSWKCCSKCFTSDIHPHEVEISAEIFQKDEISYFEHSSICTEDFCEIPKCKRYKEVISHYMYCNDRLNCKCCHAVSKLLIAHAAKCPINSDCHECPVIDCGKVKDELLGLKLIRKQMSEVTQVGTLEMMEVDDRC